MKITKEDLHENFHRCNHWSRIHFESDDGNQKSTVLFCASQEYLWDMFRAIEPNQVNLEKWQESVFKKWNELGYEIFRSAVHYDVYATSADGHVNTLHFLQDEIKP